MRPDTSHHAPPEEQIVDRYLDGDLLPDEACRLFDELRSDPARSRELFAMQRAIQALGEPVHAPDLSRPILAAVARRKGLVGRPQRQIITLGRVAAAAALALAFAGVYTIHRFAPDLTAPGVARPQPIGDLKAGVTNDVPQAIDSIQQRIGGAIAQQLQPPAGASASGAELLIDSPPDVLPLAFTSADAGALHCPIELDSVLACNLVARGDVVLPPPAAEAVDQPALAMPPLVFPTGPVVQFRPSFATTDFTAGMPGVIQRPDGTVRLLDPAAAFERPPAGARRPRPSERAAPSRND